MTATAENPNSMNPDSPLPFLDFLQQRRSLPARLLVEPGPDAEQLEILLTTAIRVPDHGRMTPWRFIRIAGSARAVLGECLAAALERDDPDTLAPILDKERGRFSQAPLVIAVIGIVTVGHRIPEVEQRSSAAAVCFQMLLAAEAMGFAGQWLTGPAAYHADIHAALGLAGNEEITGFIHLGTASQQVPERVRPQLGPLLSDWQP